jgi:hypothetical protein
MNLLENLNIQISVLVFQPENWPRQQLMQIQQKNNPFYIQLTSPSPLKKISCSSHMEYKQNKFIFRDILHKTLRGENINIV